ncbi:DMT family transporter [Arenibaculum sp.]|uniref:DMT family transporter n=1 Tax=Arenibaculum sp. TaxID=2865862 RepID=UPI002E1567A9|nr:EamA family transporter [Arenibaculum sp.]
MKPLDIAAILVVMAIWGCNFVVAKVALTEFSPIFVMFLRFTLVALLIVPFVRVPREKMKGIVIFSFLLGTIHFPLMFTGLQGLDAATTSIAGQLSVPFSSLLAAFFFKDRLGWRRALGMAVAFGGIVVIAGEPRVLASLGHLWLVVGAAFAFALANIHVKGMGEVDGFALNGWMALFAAPQLLTVSMLAEENQWAQLTQASWIGWACILYMVVMVTIVSYGVWYPLLRRYDVNQTMPWTLTVPVFGVASAVLFLGEPLTPALLAGGLVTLTGVAVVVIRRPRAAAPSAGNVT